MEDFSLDDTFCFYEPSSSRYPAPIFRMSSRDLARFGQLYLQKGEWQSERILDADWIERSWTPRTIFEEGNLFGAGNGFGYLWWIYPAREDASMELLRHDAYVTRGAAGQVLAVVPSLNLVAVHQTDTENGRDVDFDHAIRVIGAAVAAYQGGGNPSRAKTGELRPELLPDAKPAPVRRKAIPWTRAMIEGVVGEYRLNPQVMMEVHEVDGRLFAQPKGAPLAEVELFAETPDRFFSPVVDLLVEAERDANGMVIRLKGNVNGRPSEIVRIVAGEGD